VGCERLGTAEIDLAEAKRTNGSAAAAAVSARLLRARKRRDVGWLRSEGRLSVIETLSEVKMPVEGKGGCSCLEERGRVGACDGADMHATDITVLGRQFHALSSQIVAAAAAVTAARRHHPRAADRRRLDPGSKPLSASYRTWSGLHMRSVMLGSLLTADVTQRRCGGPRRLKRRDEAEERESLVVRARKPSSAPC
jgi:hypothetical protein